MQQLSLNCSVYVSLSFLPLSFLATILLTWYNMKAHFLGRFWSQLSCCGGRTLGGHSAFHPQAFKGRERERQKGGQKERTKEFRGMHYSARLEITLFTGSTKPKCPGGFHYLSFSNAAEKKKSSHLSRSQFQESQFIQLNGIKAAVGKRFERRLGEGNCPVPTSIYLPNSVCMCVCKTHSFK